MTGSEEVKVNSSRGLRRSLDPLDWEILEVLRRSPRISSREIAEILGASLNTVVGHMRKLKRINAFQVKAGLIIKSLQYSFCFAFIEVKGQNVAEVAKEILRIPELTFASSTIAGAFNIVASFRFFDQTDLIAILHDKLAKIDGVHRFETSTVLKAPLYRPTYMDFSQPGVEEPIDELTADIREFYPDDVVDHADAQIIAALQQNGRRSVADIAQITGLNAGTIRYRIKALETRDIIHFMTLLNPRISPYEHIALVRIEVQAGELNNVVARLSGVPWLPQLFVCTGTWTLLGFALTHSLNSLIDLEAVEVKTISGVIGAEVLPMIHVFRVDARLAQKENELMR